MPLRPEATDRAPWHRDAPARQRVASERRSLHVTMRDGVRIAVDVHLPRERSGKLPVILRQTRYFRGVAFRAPFTWLPVEWLLDHAADTRERFLAAGYGWVDVCARGSGASFGRRPCPWSPDEVADGGEIAEWIVGQPWSNGRIGSTGVSYDGTTCEMLLVNGHPAVQAVCPRFSLYDVYTDVAFPGGIHLAWFTEAWGGFNRALDTGRLDAAFANMLRVQIRALRAMPQPAAIDRALSLADSEAASRLYLAAVRRMARGVRPVDEDGELLLGDAIRAHGSNFDVHQGALAITCRDDAGVAEDYPDASIDFFSPHAHVDALRAAGVPIYGYSGWLDAAYQHGAIKRHRAVGGPTSQLIIGPWDHGGLGNVSPFSPSAKAAFDQDGELLRFFDRHLRGADHDDPPVRYFTIGQERWKSADRWPPPGFTPCAWFLAEGGTLQTEAPDREDVDRYRVDLEVTTGRRSRWDSLLGLLPPVGYSRRRELGARCLVYRSLPLEHGIEITGHPVVTLFLSSDVDDPHLFAYLEHEQASGVVHYVTEGQLRVAHRESAEDAAYPHEGPWRSFRRADFRPVESDEVVEVRFDLLPISWEVPRGDRLRLVVAGADREHFALPASVPTLAIHRGGTRMSRLDLPICRVDP